MSHHRNAMGTHDSAQEKLFEAKLKLIVVRCPGNYNACVKYGGQLLGRVAFFSVQRSGAAESKN